MNLAFIQGIGLLELTIVLVILLLVLGPKRLPAMGRSLGSGLRELRKAVTSRHDDDGEHPDANRDGKTAVLDRRPSDAVPEERPLEDEVVPERR